MTPRSATASRAAAGPDPADLLAWYDRHRRTLPWRALPHEPADPYAVWVSEVMLQQTTVKAVAPRYGAFLARFPTVTALAAAPEEEVMKAWAGLGYYRRARALHAGAKAVAERLGGVMPSDEAGLLEVPGIGPYTAAAVAAIAFGLKATPVDGNVERVVARLFAVETPLPKAKPQIGRLAATLTPDARAGDFAQAMMDLGATICTPRKPACALCPWRGGCRAAARGDMERFPLKTAKAARPQRLGVAFVAVRADGAVLLRRRPAEGLLGGMTEVATTPFLEVLAESAAADAMPLAASWRPKGSVRHVFTHFELTLDVRRAEVPLATAAPPGSWWSTDLPGEALPTVMRKAIAAALGE